MLSLQTIRSKHQKDAKGTTQEEFEDAMAQLVEFARKEMKKKGLKPLFSYDNNKIQAGADLERMGLEEDERVPLAAYMPDGHQVIEHVFGQLKASIWNDLYEHGDIRSAHDAQARFHRLFKKLPKFSIAANAFKMPLVYEMIATEKGVLFMGPDGSMYQGTGGDWALRPHR